MEASWLRAVSAGYPAVLASDDRTTGGVANAAPRILIVEDEYLVAIELEAALSDVGYTVVGIATRAADALRLAKAERPALVVMDISLAGRSDGIEAAIRIYQATGIRCIFATAYAEPRMRERAQAAAPLAWLPKPYSLDALIALIRDALRDLRH